MRARPVSLYRRRRAVAFGVLLVVALVASILVLRSCAGGARRLTPAAGTSGNHYDPLAYDEGKRSEFEQRAAAGFMPLLFEKSPGGALASARRTARWRPLIERAVRGTGVDPDTVEGIILLESAGRPDIIAGSDPSAAAGLSQILAGTATSLLGMHVNLDASRRLTKRIATAEALGNARALKKLRARRRKIDDRFDPARALAGTVRYLVLAKKRFGREDLAIASYHMGMGNLATVLQRFGGDPKELSYARVYFDSTPLLHPAAYRLLSSFGDDSSTYLWRVLAAERIMGLYRTRPQALSNPQLLGPAPTGSLTQPPARPVRFGLAFQGQPGPARALLPAALSTLIYIGVGTKDIARGGTLTMTRAAAGIGFDIARRYRDHNQALAFQFMLDRLTALNLIEWQRAGDRIRVGVSGAAAKLLGPPAKLEHDALL